MPRDSGPNVDALVLDGIATLLRKSGKDVPVLTDDQRLDDLGLTSLDVTTLLVELTERLGPAAADSGATEVDIATVGDLRRALAPGANAGADIAGDTLAATRRRAEARRTGGR